MAIKILLLVFFAIIVAEAAPPLPAEWTAANKSISDMEKTMSEAADSVLATAPEAKKEQAQKEILKHMMIVGLVLAKAKETGDEKKVVDTARSYEIASNMVLKAPPADKLRVMENTFFSVAAPDPTECPNVDKAYCETIAKIETASREVISAAPAEKMEKVAEAVAELRFGTDTTMNKAYVEGPKKIPGVLAAYIKASDAVIAAAPTEKLKVMEKAFTAATAQSKLDLVVRGE